jgi:MFS family permease
MISRAEPVIEGAPAGVRGLLQLRGTRTMVLLGGASRLPLATGGVAIVLSVGAASKSYSIAGAAAAVAVLSAAFAAPQLARLMDRHGQRAVLIPAAGLAGLAWLALALLCAGRADTGWLLLAALACGLSSADVGSAVRARWAGLIEAESPRRAAFMVESVADEVMYILGPVTVTGVGSLAPSAAPVVVCLGPLIGWLGLAQLRSTIPSPPIERPGASLRWRPHELRVVAPLVLTFVALGCYLASIEVLLVATNTRSGHPLGAGVALAAWALGSGVAALVLARRGVSEPRTVLMGGITVMAVFGLLFPVNDGPIWLTGVCLFAGIGAAPAIGAGFALGSEAGGGTGRAEAMTWMSTGLGVGSTIGAFIAGRVADGEPSGSAYLLCSGLGLVAVAAAVLATRWHSGGRTRPNVESGLSVDG